MTITLIRLAFAGIRSRILASALTILLCTASAATIVLALEVGATVRAIRGSGRLRGSRHPLTSARPADLTARYPADIRCPGNITVRSRARHRDSDVTWGIATESP